MKKAPAKKVKPVVKAEKPLTPAQRCEKYGIEQLCADIQDTKTLNSIAAGLSVSIGTLLTWIDASSERSARAREARMRTAKLWDEKAETVIEDAKDPFELSKAKELASHYRWRASKIAPRDFGDKLALGGADDLPPIRTMTTEQLKAKIAEKVKALGLDAAKPD
jgi:hypothetical protein